MFITRNFFGWYWEGAQEVSQLIIIWITLFGAALAASDEKHINMSALRELSSKRVKPFILLAIGVPNVLVILIPTILSITFYYPELSFSVVIQQMVSGVSPFALIAIPLFIFAAEIVLRGQLADKLINFALSLVGHLHGGLAQSLCLACILFGSVSGSTQATVAAVGAAVYPSMIK